MHDLFKRGLLVCLLLATTACGANQVDEITDHTISSTPLILSPSSTPSRSSSAISSTITSTIKPTAQANGNNKFVSTNTPTVIPVPVSLPTLVTKTTPTDPSINDVQITFDKDHYEPGESVAVRISNGTNEDYEVHYTGKYLCHRYFELSLGNTFYPGLDAQKDKCTTSYLLNTTDKLVFLDVPAHQTKTIGTWDQMLFLNCSAYRDSRSGRPGPCPGNKESAPDAMYTFHIDINQKLNGTSETTKRLTANLTIGEGKRQLAEVDQVTFSPTHPRGMTPLTVTMSGPLPPGNWKFSELMTRELRQTASSWNEVYVYPLLEPSDSAGALHDSWTYTYELPLEPKRDYNVHVTGENKYFDKVTALFLEYESTKRSFSDIPQTNSYYPAVQYLSEGHNLPPHISTNFLPDQPITRAEAVHIAMSLADQPGTLFSIWEKSCIEEAVDDPSDACYPAVKKTFPFSDVPTSHASYKFINEAFQRDLIPSVDLFRPEEPATKLFVLQMALDMEAGRLNRGGANISQGTVAAKDAISTEERTYFARASELELITLDTNGNFNFQSPISRAEAAQLFYRSHYYRWK